MMACCTNGGKSVAGRTRESCCPASRNRLRICCDERLARPTQTGKMAVGVRRAGQARDTHTPLYRACVCVSLARVWRKDEVMRPPFEFEQRPKESAKAFTAFSLY